MIEPHLPVDMPEGVPPYDIDFLGEPQYDEQREEIRLWSMRKLEARAIRKALPMWPMYCLVFLSCLAPTLQDGIGYARTLAAMAFGYAFAQMVTILRSALLEHRAERRMQQGIRRLINWQPGTP